MTNRWGSLSLSIGIMAALGGCGGSRLISPHVREPLQSEWTGTPEYTVLARSLGSSDPWWYAFHDPVLNQIMAKGLAQNLDIKLAASRISQARALRKAAAAALYPDFSATSNAQTNHAPAILVPAGSPTNDLEAAVAGNWNVDLFGVLRNQERAAAASLRATEFDYDQTRIAMASGLATTYLQFRLYQVQYLISQRSAVSQAETVRITRVRFEQGAASRLDLERVESQLDIVRAAVPQAFEQAENARSMLVFLLATTPEELSAFLPKDIPEDLALPTGSPLEVLLTPAEVLLLRPDVHSAEQQLIAASANLKAALAERYPQLSLAALFGTEGTALNQLMTSASKAWSYSAGLTLPLLDFGRIRASIDLADAQQLQAYLTYEQTVRSALQATQSAIVLYTQGVLRVKQMEAALESARTAARLARAQYQEGALSLLDVLDAERTAYDTELDWSQVAAAVSERLVSVYQNIGIAPPATTG